MALKIITLMYMSSKPNAKTMPKIAKQISVKYSTIQQEWTLMRVKSPLENASLQCIVQEEKYNQ